MEKQQDEPQDRVSEFFERDHREIDALLADVAFDSGREAAAKFAEFDARLERHIRWEESILFPAVARNAPDLAMGPIRVMSMEHELIREGKTGALAALNACDAKRARQFVEAMERVLRDHNFKEEQFLYPACDNLLSMEERRIVLQQVRSGTA
ncbi:MAG: hemerythrin domain-containing protein [Elusimicrobia bacterium]|nr:hemerythrin domain-containing protein [Elusimicrobiota bacterium]